MLSYQHVYHAGNHADILKHYVLCSVIQSLNKKEKPYTLFDTHSGSGLYDMLDNRSQKTNEASKGIFTLIQYLKDNPEQKAECPDSFITYLDLVQKYLDKNLYPGSPVIEYEKMRSQDTLILSELHPAEIINLKQTFKNNLPVQAPNEKSVQIHNRSGWEMLYALTPPKTKRGAVLIDPSYEETQDYIDAAKTICTVHKKWSGGIIMLWYPLLTHRQNEIQTMINTIKDCVQKTNANTAIDNLILCAKEKDESRMYGSGMLVINTPWQLAQEAEQVIQKCGQVFYSS